MADVQKIAEDLSTLTVLEASELTKILEEKWGVSAAAPVAVAAAAGGAPAEAAAGEEKTEFEIHLAASGDKKINVIKEVRTITGLGLKEAKDLVEKSLPAPALDFVLKCSHTFNLLEARGVISVTERTATIGRIRSLARKVAESWLSEREKLGFPLC